MSSSSSRDRVAPLSGVSGSPSCPFLGHATTLTFAAGCEWGHKEVLQTMTDARDRRLLLASARADLLEGGGAPERQGVPDHVGPPGGAASPSGCRRTAWRPSTSPSSTSGPAWSAAPPR